MKKKKIKVSILKDVTEYPLRVKLLRARANIGTWIHLHLQRPSRPLLRRPYKVSPKQRGFIQVQAVSWRPSMKAVKSPGTQSRHRTKDQITDCRRLTKKESFPVLKRQGQENAFCLFLSSHEVWLLILRSTQQKRAQWEKLALGKIIPNKI